MMVSEFLSGAARTTRSVSVVGRIATASAPSAASDATSNWYCFPSSEGDPVTFFVHLYVGASDMGPPYSAMTAASASGQISSWLAGVVAELGAMVSVSSPAVAPLGNW